MSKRRGLNQAVRTPTEARDVLNIWVVYDHPKDFPGCFIARRWVLTSKCEPTEEVRTGQTLEELRSRLPQGLVCFDRAVNDDRCIVEVWM